MWVIREIKGERGVRVGLESGGGKKSGGILGV